ncbi:MAG: hypothetical protein DI539_06850 [Flavobacterium psychrophilum]|nr:MAG: hypothetical protein DI539_06850 [Flavobacterium psychrophilum]
MKYLLYLSVISLVILGCNSNKEPEIKFIQSTKLVLKNTPKYSLHHPDTWVERGFKSNSNSEIFDLWVKAYADVSYNYMILPDSVNTDNYTHEMKKSIMNRGNLLESKSFTKQGKDYFKIVYKLEDPQESRFEHVIFVRKQEIYSIHLSYSKKMTPPGYIKQGREILDSFIVK